MPNETKLRILCYNSNGIYNGRLILQVLLHSLGIDIALISETQLPIWFEWRNPGYWTYNTRGPNMVYGGTAVLVKANIQHAYVGIPMMNSLQTTAIIVELNGLEIIIGAVYQSSVKPFEEDDFDKLIGLLKRRKFIFGGKFNCKHTDWNSRLITSNGRKLAMDADKHEYAILALDRPTHYLYQQKAAPDVLEIFLQHSYLPVDDVVALSELNSHHFPVLLTLKCSMSTRVKPDTCHISSDVYRQQLKLIELPSDYFLSTKSFETGIKIFSDTLKSAEFGGQVRRPH